MNNTKADFQISMKAARVNAELTQSDIARLMHVSNKTVNNWENGKVKPSFAQLNTYCQIVKVPINRISLP